MKVERKESNTKYFYEIEVGEMFERTGIPYLKIDEAQAFNFITNEIDEFATEYVATLHAKVVIE